MELVAVSVGYEILADVVAEFLRVGGSGRQAVPVEKVEAAAVKAVDAHHDLQVIGMPFEAWLDGFELPWIGETDGREADM